MSTAQPAGVPARHYPPGGDAHGQPVLIHWQGERLAVHPEAGPAFTVAAAALGIAPHGFNHSQWAINWRDAGGEHLLIASDADVTPLRDAAPNRFAAGQRAQTRASRRFVLGITALAAIPALFIGGLFLSVGPLSDRVVEHIPPSVETQIGAAVLEQTRAAGPLIESGPAFDALQTIGHRLSRPGETYRFILAQRPEVNAFAAPGGIVVVHSALMASADSAEEVAGVLAHEIAHVELRHSLRQMVRSAGLTVIFTALSGDYTVVSHWAGRLGELKYSRDAEREADARALQRLADAHISPTGLVKFFDTLATDGKSRMPTLLSTHPAVDERLASLKARIAANPPTNATPIGIDWAPVKAALAAKNGTPNE